MSYGQILQATLEIRPWVYRCQNFRQLDLLPFELFLLNVGPMPGLPGRGNHTVWRYRPVRLDARLARALCPLPASQVG